MGLQTVTTVGCDVGPLIASYTRLAERSDTAAAEYEARGWKDAARYMKGTADTYRSVALDLEAGELTLKEDPS